jgi:carbon storage regulator
MLVLSRKRGEEIIIADNIRVTVLEVHGSRVKIGINAPGSAPIYRAEVSNMPERRMPHAEPEAALV